MNNKCFYLVEGACERQLINALKAEPARLIPGSIIVHNVVQKTIPKAYVASFGRNSFVAIVFDTDIPQTDILKENISLLKKHCAGVRLIYLAQVLNFEDEITRATDVKSAADLTRSPNVRTFKSDFVHMKIKDCRNALERHHLEVKNLWIKQPPTPFDFFEQNGHCIKTICSGFMGLPPLLADLSAKVCCIIMQLAYLLFRDYSNMNRSYLGFRPHGCRE